MEINEDPEVSESNVTSEEPSAEIEILKDEQVSNSKKQDNDHIFKSKIPMKAAILSLFLPGGGQFYNESYWKASGVLALEGSLIGLTTYHHIISEEYYAEYKKYKKKYIESGNQNQQYYNEYIKNYNKYVVYYNKRQSDFWWLCTVIFLSTLDAYVDAHLFNFEENKKKIHLKFENKMISLQYNF